MSDSEERENLTQYFKDCSVCWNVWWQYMHKMKYWTVIP